MLEVSGIKKSKLFYIVPNFDIFCIRETKLKENDRIKLKFSGFTCHRGDRRSDNNIGVDGVAIFIKKEIKHTLLEI